MVTLWIIKCLIDAAAICLFVQAVNACFWEGMIFGRIGAKIETSVPDWVYKPTIGCPVCMAFWWGFLAEATLFDMNSILAPFLAMGMCAIIVKLDDND